MATSVEMPELGESVTEGTITTWLKEVGDTVEVDEPLLEVSTDKVDTEIPSPVAGVLIKVLAEEDDTVEVGDIICEIGEEGEKPASFDEEGEAEAEEPQEEEKAEEADKSEPKQEDKSAGSASDVTMPELGESVTEGTITTWLKEVGDEVEVDEPLLEVSTDKVDTEIPSPVAGTLVEILANEDDTVEVGDVIARIGDKGAAPAPKSDDKPKEEEKADKAKPKEEKKAEGADRPEPKEDKSAGSASDVTMPELGESVTEGTITTWLKEVGDEVEVDEPLLEVSTDKVDTEIPSPVAGTLVEILANEDDTVEVGDVIARIGDKGAAPAPKSDDKPKEEEKADKAKPKEEKKADKPEPKQEEKKAEPADKPEPKEDKAEKADASASGDDHVPYVTPLVRKLAKKHNVDLNKVEGSGIGGRVRKQDILAIVNGEDTKGTAEQGSSAAPRTSSKSVDPEKAELRGTTKKVNRIRQITAKKTLEALQTAAQLTQLHEVDMTRVAELRKANKQAFQDKYGVKLTYLPFFAKAIVEALVSHPNVNASYNAETAEMTYHDSVNLAIAVDTKQGLLTPVIHDAQDLSLPELAQAIVDIADRARNSKLKPNDLAGATFTITNIGSEGALSDTPIVVPPQAAMVGTGAITKRPVVVTENGVDAIAVRQMVYLPMTYDHQVVDGADAGRFMTTVRDRLENIDFAPDLGL
ncbi:2-oxoglutarate dehydrogenase, E2 component, dihydrolipoamide succinyltransferase [Corynebacterium pyruviciproducens]|uniref:Dihydrolipoamide acetyltransferase component of pyruvate dehydrogenase complex n=1 Tax=Corynebacterium pyruviciproducens TaxID=598660 RepID=A0AAF1BZQ3_9CORY|nr:2-oxoglutarate dehydrogenase, E2 component, dihydrolipoamide succinyltransferase [Corynebacterium pyruviciproducens]WOT02930.1 2-oxoglutarate dehydrogenase, E2 component, dihydrolipoamide succinyltransferase [Corynebacterium pyruviciproducens]